MRLVVAAVLLVGGAGAVGLASCSTYRDDLLRSERFFEASEHERALAILRVLEPDTDRLSVIDRAHYAYLRGMTDYRIGYRSDARHWLAIASSIDQQTPGCLPPEWETRMVESLKELNEEVYAGGIAALSGPASDKSVPAEDSADAQAPDGDEPR
jgi:hypothetical protein